jgi:hypothetical protein
MSAKRRGLGSRGGVAYMGLAGEIVRREREEQKLDKETA